MGKGENVFFKELNEKEKLSKLFHLTKSAKPRLTLWLKGTKDKFTLNAEEYFQHRKEMYVTGSFPEDFYDQTVLFAFELNGVHYFGEANIISFAKTKTYLEFKGKMYKSERRKNFRLLTYPHQQVFVHILTDDEELMESNVVSIKTGMSQTQIFKRFLGMVNAEDGGERSMEGYIKLRVVDISVTGLGMHLSDLEKKKLPMQVNLGEMILDFNGEHIKLPGAKILYVLDGLAADKKTKIYKAGVKFLDMDISTDHVLAAKINKTLRTLESEFEDFLK